MIGQKEAVRTVTGWRGDANYFTPREYYTFVPEAVLDVLHGRAACVIFRGMVSHDVYSEVARRFWGSPHRRVRGAEAPGYYLGAYTWGKSTAEYLDESEIVNPILEDLLDIPGNPVKEFYDGLSRALAAEGCLVRTAEHRGRRSSIALLRSWHGAGDFALAPHDDDSQCTDPLMADFERTGVVGRPVAALNMCVENHEGGRLVLWNVRPDDESKRRLGVEFTGSPYPVEALEGSDVEYIEIDSGDVYVFNGAHVHAVEPNTDGLQTRTTILGMMGFIDDHTVATWS
ncbi:hypothetical protein GCM10023322_71470 [Rugosimonospora acidiphila]|uniref:Fe2OG dioxygenase domain-containing protein n=1 Tax=Rugosimonospora acidiphila TaxID=556531 RepID=A0ABP9SNI3_9ACTN